MKFEKTNKQTNKLKKQFRMKFKTKQKKTNKQTKQKTKKQKQHPPIFKSLDAKGVFFFLFVLGKINTELIFPVVVHSIYTDKYHFPHSCGEVLTELSEPYGRLSFP